MATENVEVKKTGALEKLGKSSGSWLKDNWQELLVGAGVYALMEGTNVINLWEDDPFRDAMQGKDGDAWLDKPFIDFWGGDGKFNLLPEFNGPWNSEYTPKQYDLDIDGFDDRTGEAIDNNFDGKVDTGIAGKIIYIDTDGDGMADVDLDINDKAEEHKIVAGESYWDGKDVLVEGDTAKPSGTKSKGS